MKDKIFVTAIGSVFCLLVVISLFAHPILNTVNNHDAGWISNNVPANITYCPDVCGNFNPPMYAEHRNNGDGTVSNVCRIRRVDAAGVVRWFFGTNHSNNPNICNTSAGPSIYYRCLCVDYLDNVDSQD